MILGHSLSLKKMQMKQRSKTKNSLPAGRMTLLGILLMLLPLTAFGQQLTVKGTVRDASGEPLPGVNIIVEGTTAGTVVAADGSYSIQVPSSSSVLVYSFIGYNTEKVQVKGQPEVNVTMIQTIENLEEVVVTGYQVQKKVDVTGAIAVVEMKKIASQSLSSGNVMQALQGNVAGLYVEKSGNPSGESSRILIRGVNTLGNTDPLYIIDGVPTVRPVVFQSLNPSGIESVQVLKDASASSIYGSRASNGVIIITTKNRIKESGEKFNISLNSNFSILSEKKQRYKMLNALDRGKVLWQANVNDHTDPNAGYGEIYKFDWNGDYANPVLNSISVQPYVGGDESMPVGDTDWQEVSYQTGYVYNNDLTISGGTENAFLLANFGYLKNTGILKYTNYDRYSGRLNSNFKLFKGKLKVGVNSQFAKSNETGSCMDIGSTWTPRLAIQSPPTIPLFGKDGVTYGGPLGSGYSDRNNPVLMQYLNRWDNTANTSIFGNVFAELNIVENLVFRTSVGIDYNAFNRKDIEPKVQNGFVNRSDNSLTISTSNYSSLTFTNTLNYKLKIENNSFEFLLGSEAIKTNVDDVVSTAYSFAVETEDYFVLGAASGQRTTNGRGTGSRLLSQFGKIGYSFSDKYLASVTIRRDGSSKFGTDNQYGIFPSATLGWRISNESFMKALPALSNLKLRAGYGVVGNQSIGDLARFGLFESRYGPSMNTYSAGFFEQYYNIGTAYDLNGANSGTLMSGFVSIQAENVSLKWESTKETNFGIDFGFFNNKLMGAFDYFVRTTENILIQPPIASAIGEGQLKWLNGATKDNRGWELTLSYSDKLRNGLTYDVSTNLGAFKDEITELPEEVRTAYPGNAEKTILGQSQYAIFGYRSDGLFQNDEEVIAAPAQVGAAPGRIRYKDLNGDKKIDSYDQEFIGTTLPKLEYGIRLNVGYKNFDVSVFGSGVAGRIGRDTYMEWDYFVQGRENAGPDVLNAWTPNNKSSKIPAVTLSNNNNELRSSDFMFRNNSYFKLRNLQIGYSIPVEIVKKWGIHQMRVYYQGENLFWITPKDYIGNDPERTNVNNIPVPTTNSFGISVNF